MTDPHIHPQHLGSDARNAPGAGDQHRASRIARFMRALARHLPADPGGESLTALRLGLRYEQDKPLRR
jgi:hypothetical protein